MTFGEPHFSGPIGVGLPAIALVTPAAYRAIV